VFQQSKVTAIDINRTTIVLPDGTTQYRAIKNVFGDRRPMIEDVGTIFSQAIVKNNRFIYFPDIYSGEIYRKAPNGLFPVSDYKMSKYFRDKFNTLLASGVSNLNMVAGWDSVNKMYVLTFLDSDDSTNNETVAFHEPTNRWYSFYSFKPKLYAKIGETKFISFVSPGAGDVYVHHSDSEDRCTFYDTAYDFEVWAVFNDNPLNIKRFNSLTIDCNRKIGAEDEDGIVIASDSAQFTDSYNNIKYQADMVSRLKKERFRYRNGVYKANFLRNAKTTSDTFSQNDLQTGAPLKGPNMLVKLKIEECTSETYLRSLVAHNVLIM